MEVEQRVSKIQLLVKAAEQYGRLKFKQVNNKKDYHHHAAIANHGSTVIDARPSLPQPWTKTSREVTKMAPNANMTDKKAENNDKTEGMHTKHNDGMTMLQVLAFNALDLTAPASDVLVRNRRSSWVQLSGHPGSFALAGPGTVWKKYQGTDSNEKRVYEELMKDVAVDIVPKFYREVNHKGEGFIEMQDLLYGFTDPNVMDIKMGTRTFLETEVSNSQARSDLYEKMVKIDPSAPTREEHEIKAVTKLRYMTFREEQSSTCSLGFRVEAIKFQGSPPTTDLKTIRTREEVKSTLSVFLSRNPQAKGDLLRRFQYIRKIFEMSPYFQNHEIVGSSILIVYDNDHIGAWIIDFAKTVPLPPGVSVTHRKPWVLGNHEEGYLTGIDNLIEILEELK